MFRYRRPWLVLLVALSIAPTAGLHAADGILSVIPKNALGFVMVRNASRTSDKIGELTAKLEVQAPNVLAFAKSITGLAAGVNFDGDVALALVTQREQGDAPVPVLMLPVTDFDAFVKSLGGTAAQNGVWEVTFAGKRSTAIHKGDFALLTELSNRAILSAIASSATGVGSQLDSIAPWTREMDAFAVGMPRGISMAQREILAGLTAAKEQIRKQMEQQGQQAETVVKGIEIYEQMFGAADKEIALIAAGVRLDDQGNIHILSRTVPKPDGVLARLSANVEPLQGDWFRGIPQGPFVFAGGGVYPTSAMKELTEWSIQMMQSTFGMKLNEQQARDFSALAVESAQGVRGLSMSMGVAAESEPLYGNMVLVLRVDDADAYMETYKTTVEKMAEIGRDSGSPFFAYEVSKFEADGLQGLQLTMDMTAMAALQPGPQEAQKAIMQAMFGEGGKLRVYLAAADKETILGTYVSQERLVSAIANFRDGKASFSQMPEIKKVRGLLPADPAAVGYWSIGGTMAFLRTMLKSVVPDVPAAIPSFPDTLPIGVAVSTAAGGVESNLVVPFEVAKTIADFAKAMTAQKPATQE